MVAAEQTTAAAAAGPIRVMVVDDSAVIRGLISRWIAAEPDMEVVATAPNGAQALRQAEKSQPEVIVLDIEMPEMDGLAALPEILRLVRGVRVLMSSTLTRAGAEVSIKALTLGAADYLTKPSSTRESGAVEAFRVELLQKARALGAARRRTQALRQAGAAPLRPSSIGAAHANANAGAERQIRLHHGVPIRPQILAIGSSTGGPQAVSAMLAPIAARLRVPIVITQHMPATFTAIFADHLGKATGVEAAEAVDGEVIRAGRIYVAPGNRHMIVARDGDRRVLRLTDGPPENFCRPAVDPMLRSIAEVYGAASLVVILTGMGHDGLAGSRAIVEAGGRIIAQDEASSVVWGMPGAVANAGICSAVLPLGDIGAQVDAIIRGPLLAGGLK